MSGADAFFLTFTNLAFILPFVEAVKRHHYTYAFVYIATVFASGFYHACWASYMVCWLSPTNHQHLDFFLSYLLIPMTLLYLIDWSPKWAFIHRWLILSFALAIFILRVQVPSSEHVAVELGLAGTAFGMLLLYWVAVGLPHYDWRYLSGAFLLTAISLAFFTWQEDIGYTVSHSIWHVSAALAQFLLLRSRAPAPRYAAMDSRIPIAVPIKQILF